MQRDIPDLIEKKCPAVCQHELAIPVFMSIRKSSPDMAEEFGFKEGIGECRQVRQYKRPGVSAR